MPELPDLKLLDESALPAGLQDVSIRTLRRLARQYGLCYFISRKTYVTEAQLAELIELFRMKPSERRTYSRRSLVSPRFDSEQAQIDRLLKRIEEPSKPKRRR